MLAADSDGVVSVCSRMLTYAHVCSRMLTYAHVCSRMLTHAPQVWPAASFGEKGAECTLCFAAADALRLALLVALLAASLGLLLALLLA